MKNLNFYEFLLDSELNLLYFIKIYLLKPNKRLLSMCSLCHNPGFIAATTYVRGENPVVSDAQP